MICSKCNKQVIDRPKSYNCDCTTVWKEIAGKQITEDLAEKLFTEGYTDVLDGFISKAQRPFRAILIVESGKVVFRFPESSEKKESLNSNEEQAHVPKDVQAKNGTIRLRIESENTGTVFISIPGISSTQISYGLVPSRQAECLGCITAANLVKHFMKPMPKLKYP